MVKCFVCRSELLNFTVLKFHFNSIHSKNDLKIYVCIENDCGRKFQLLNSFRRHFFREHNSDSEVCIMPIQLPQQNATCLPRESIPELDVQVDVAVTDAVANKDYFVNSASVVADVSSIETTVEKSLSIFIASLYANPLLPRNAVQTIINGFEEFLSNSVVPAITERLELLFAENSISSTSINTLSNNLLLLITSPWNQFNTEHKRLQYFNNIDTYIKPQEVIIGQRFDSVKRAGVTRMVPVACKQHFIPLRHVLKNFFCLENILSETLNYMTCLINNNQSGAAVENFIQGSFWQSRLRERSNKTVIPFFIFFDDYETGNVLGSRSGQHKLGAVYASIPCLPPTRSSILNNIFLTLLFHSSDRALFGNKVIFRCIIDECNYLSEAGIHFDIPGYKGTIYFELGLIIGDNLGIHSMTGFVESFSANFACRICKTRKDVMKSQCWEDVTLLRTSTNYESDLLTNNVAETGIKERCIWLDVKGFDLFNQVGVDCMHDILEGVAKYVMNFVLLQYIRHFKLFSLFFLNERLHAFAYGPDSKNQPCSLSIEHLIQGNVRFSASEMLTFLRYFGLLVGDLVPRGDDTWALYLQLRKVLEIVLCTAFANGTDELLQSTIAELNQMYMSVTHVHLKPKFHHMIHYHSALKKFGPLVSLWSMRFEAKHRISKIAARASCNRRNITWSLSMKHQLNLNAIFICGKLSDILKTGPVKRVLSFKVRYLQTLLQLCPSKSITKVNWATVSSTRYTEGTILVNSTSNDMLVTFLKVKSIYLYDSTSLIFEGTLFRTVSFDDHLFAYEVKEPEATEMIVLFYNKLVSPIPCNINVLTSGKTYITIRSPL